MQPDISVLHVVAGLHPNAGGPSRTIVQLVDALARERGMAVSLLSQTLTKEPVIQSTATSVCCSINQTSSRSALALGLPLRRGLQGFAGSMRPRLIHSHGLWLPANAWAARLARRERIPLLIHPHGMLEAWALQHRGWKKRLALRLYQHRDLETAALLFATAEQEAISIRRLGLRQPIAIIPNGVDVVQRRSLELKPVDVQQGPRTVLFLGRIHPIKGLLNLIESWGRLHPKDWRLCIAGPDEGGHLAEVLKKVRRLGLENCVDYVGEVKGDSKTTLFQNADLFVLPSFSENFGVVVAEALAHGVPVITTRSTPWEGLLHHGCGWWIDTGVDPLINALRDAIALSDEERAAMGARGRVYVQRYDWNDIARQTVAAYSWVLGEGPLPDCVQVD